MMPLPSHKRGTIPARTIQKKSKKHGSTKKDTAVRQTILSGVICTRSVSTSFTAQKTAIATLTIKKLKKRDKGTSTKNEWEAERDESLQSLRLQIFFLSSFSKYVKKLYELMEGNTI